jgi:hypothetical protein
VDEFKLRRDVERGAKAKALLENDLLRESFEGLELSLVEAWRNTGADEAQRRDDAWRSLKLLEKLKKGLEKAVTDGDYSAKKLLDIKSKTIIEKVINR